MMNFNKFKNICQKAKRQNSTEMKRNFNGQRDFVTCLKEVIYWQRIILFVMLLCWFHSKLLYAALIVLYKIQHVFIVLLPIFILHHSNTFSTWFQRRRINLCNSDYVNPKDCDFHSFGFSICKWKRYRFKLSLMRVKFLLSPISECLGEKTHCKMVLAYFASVAILAYFASVPIFITGIGLTGWLDTTDIHILAICGCLRYLNVDWSGVVHTMKWNMSYLCCPKDMYFIWTDNDLKFIDQQDP